MALLFALALLATDPSGPVAAGPPAAAVAPDQAKGAPADDYGFVAWCDGVLSGHMDLAAHLSDVLPLDEVQQKVGHAYLRAYSKALSAAPESKTVEGKKRAEAARFAGWSNWDQARQAEDKKTVIETYLGFQLPGRCEHAAVALAHDPDLFHQAPSVEEVGAIGTHAVVASQDMVRTAAPVTQTAPAEAPAPAPMAAAPAGDNPFAVGGLAAAPAAEDAAPPPAPAAAQAEPAAQPAPPPAVQPASAKKPAAKPAKPVKAAEVQTDDGAKKPPKGHLLPWFLRGKKYGESD